MLAGMAGVAGSHRIGGQPPPMNAPGPPGYRPAMPPGSRLFFKGRLVEVFGPSGAFVGVFVYSSSPPAFGTLVDSVAVQAGTDLSGNAYLGGTTSYAKVGGTFFASNVNGGVVNFWTAATAAGPWVSAGSVFVDATGDSIQVDNNFAIGPAGFGLQVKGGAGARVGTAALAAGTVTIANTGVTASTLVVVNHRSIGPNAGVLGYSVNPGVGFTINSTNAADANGISYMLVEML